MKQLFNTLINLGTQEEQSSIEKKRIQLINYISLYLILSNIIYTIFQSFSFNYSILFAIFFCSLVFSFILYLNSRNKVLLSTHLLFLSLFIEFSFTAYLESATAFNKYYLIPVSVLPFVLYKKTATRFFVFSLTIAVFLTIHFTHSFFVPVLEYNHLNFVLDTIFAFFGMYFVIHFFIHQHEHDLQTIFAQNNQLNIQNTNLQDLNATKTKLLSIVSHDLKNPIHNILHLLENFESKELSEQELRSFTLELHRSINGQFESIENLLKWTQLQLKGIQTKPTRFHAIELMEKILIPFEKRIQSKQLRIVKNYQSPINIYADTDQIEIILNNILNNAIKFSNDHNQISIEIIEKGNEGIIEIIDNGVGFEEDIQENLFDFTKIKSTIGTHNEKGTGIGLVLCKEFSDRNNAKLQIESKKGIGSKVSLSIPLSKN